MPKTTAHIMSDTPCSQDVGGISEITILPDGRLYVLGLSKAVLEILDQAGLWRDARPPHAPPRPAGWRTTQEERQT